MENSGTAVATLWNTQSGQKPDNAQTLKQEGDHLVLPQNQLNNIVINTADAKEVNRISVGNPMTKVSNMTSLVTNLSSLVGTTSNQGVVTAFISSRPNNGITATTNATQVSKPVLLTPSQPLLLPKPSIQKVLPTTPPKVGYTPNPAVLASPVVGSPSHTWQGASPLNRKRLRPEFDLDQLDSKRRKTPNRCGPEKSGKGLRHFSMKVCEKVQQKGITSYNEVADELVQEFSEQSLKNSIQQTDQSYDQKNIRRRVYDALNVLMAMNIITKERKEIKWVGLPTNSAQECKHLEEQKLERIERIKQKQQQLKELLVQQIAFKNLVERNKKSEKKNGPPQSNACIHLPFIIVNTSKKTVIDCSISSDKSEYLFNFDEAFEIHDDIEVLKRMGLSFGLEKGECGDRSLKIARAMVPKALEPYVSQMADGTYGNMDLIDVEKLRRPVSPLATPLMITSSTATASSTATVNRQVKTTTRKKKNVNNSRTTQSVSKVISAPLQSDTDNDGDDENSTIGVN